MERLEGERLRLAGKVEKLQARLDSSAKTPILQRSEYKAVWTELSKDPGSARLHIGGVDEEAWFETTGIATKDALVSSVGITQADTVLEIGCGVGRVGKQLAPLCHKWVGCDVSPHMLKLAAQRLEGLANVEFYEISGFHLQPVPDASMDVVYSTVVFMHLEEWDRYNYVMEAKRVLRQGGRLYVDNANLCSDLGWEVFEVHRQIPLDQRPPHICKHSTESELVTYLQRAGFTGIRSRESAQFIQVWGTKGDPTTCDRIVSGKFSCGEARILNAFRDRAPSADRSEDDRTFARRRSASAIAQNQNLAFAGPADSRGRLARFHVAGRSAHAFPAPARIGQRRLRLVILSAAFTA